MPYHCEECIRHVSNCQPPLRLLVDLITEIPDLVEQEDTQSMRYLIFFINLPQSNSGSDSRKEYNAH